MHKLLILIFLVLITTSSFAQNSDHVDLGAKIIQDMDKNILAISFSNEKKWHTYWKNPGDAGLSIKVRFEVEGQKLKLKEYPWPAPKRFIEQGNMWAYGYDGKYSQFFEITNKLKNKTIKVIGEWLVCKDICIPGTKTIALNIDENLMGETNPIIDETALSESFSALPKVNDSLNVKFYLLKNKKDNQLALSYIIENADFSQITKKHNIVTPYHAFPFDYKHEEVFLDKKNKIIYGKFDIDWDGVTILCFLVI